jgi:hypothetical protein
VANSCGRALEIQKCFWYLMYWQWTSSWPELASNIACPGTTALTSGCVPIYTVIPREEVWVAKRTCTRWQLPQRRQIPPEQGKSLCSTTVTFQAILAKEVVLKP